MKSSTLPLTSPCSGTKRKTTVPLFFASTGGLRLLSFIPILLLSLQFIDFYSPSLRWFASIHGLRLPLFQTYTASVASAYWFLQSFPSLVCKYPRAKIPPLSYLYCCSLFFLLFYSSYRCCLWVCASMVGLMAYILYKNILIYTESLYKSYKSYVKKSSKSA